MLGVVPGPSLLYWARVGANNGARNNGMAIAKVQTFMIAGAQCGRIKRYLSLAYNLFNQNEMMHF